MIPQGGSIHRFILQTFARTGHSPTLEDIQREFALSSEAEANLRVVELERQGAVHRNPGDRAIAHAYPFSDEPTSHRVQLAGGPQVYAMCAIDALGIPFMLNRDAEIRSACAQCGGEVYIQVRSKHITQQNTEDIVVWFPTRKAQCIVATDLCPAVNFFCSPEHLQQWKAMYPEQNGQALTLAQALASGRKIFEPLLQGSTDKCSEGIPQQSRQ
jgi:hypothetical protein